MNEKKKPKYGMLSCISFMVKLSAKHEPLLLVSGVVMLLLILLKSLLELFLSPTILRAVEERVSIGELIGTIVLFIGALLLVNGVHTYIKEVDGARRITIRFALLGLINNKSATTSYCNLENEAYIKLEEKATNCTDHNFAAGERIWYSLFGFVQSICGFIIYLLLLTNIEPFLLSIMILTTIPAYFVNKYISGWGFRHRQEEAEIERSINCFTFAGKMESAKDVRIFNMRSWFDSMYLSAMRTLHAFHFKAARVYIWSNLIELLLTFLQNGIAYFYLIHMVLKGQLNASEFLLYFTAVSGFYQLVIRNPLLLYRASQKLS